MPPQLDPATRIGPGDRADSLALSAVVARLSAVVLGARPEHDGIQIWPEAGGHPDPLSHPLLGPRTEY